METTMQATLKKHTHKGRQKWRRKSVMPSANLWLLSFTGRCGQRVSCRVGPADFITGSERRKRSFRKPKPLLTGSTGSKESDWSSLNVREWEFVQSPSKFNFKRASTFQMFSTSFSQMDAWNEYNRLGKRSICVSGYKQACSRIRQTEKKPA